MATIQRASSGVEFGRRLQPDLEMTVAGPVLGERLDLPDQRGHQVERDADARELLEHGDHAPVVLDGVQPDPRQDVLAGGEILVIRLVHVPQQRQLHHHSCPASSGCGG